MNAEARQKLLLLFLPGLVAAAIYVFGPARKLAAEIGASETALAAALKSEPPAQAERADMARALKLPGEIDLLRLENLRLELAAGNHGAAPEAVARARSAELLGRLLAEHRLLLLEEKPEPVAPGGWVPPALQRASESPEASRLRTLTFSGKFLDVLAAVEGLERVPGIVPLRLTMRRGTGPAETLVWTLTVWI